MKNREKDALMIDEIDRSKLRDAIALISGIKEIEWSGPFTGEKDKDGNDVLVFPYPKYPKGVIDALFIAGVDLHYAENYENNCEGVPVRKMGLSQVRTMLTRMQRGERFCDGFIADEIENGNLLGYVSSEYPVMPFILSALP